MRIVPYCDPECVKVCKKSESFSSFNKLHLLFKQVMCILELQTLWLTSCQSCILLLLPSPCWWQLQCILKCLKQFQHMTWLSPAAKIKEIYKHNTNAWIPSLHKWAQKYRNEGGLNQIITNKWHGKCMGQKLLVKCTFTFMLPFGYIKWSLCI